MREERRAGLVVASAATVAGSWGGLLLFLLPLCSPYHALSGSPVWGRWEEGVTEPLGMPCLLCLVTASYCCGPQTTQGQRPRPESLSFL